MWFNFSSTKQTEAVAKSILFFNQNRTVKQITIADADSYVGHHDGWQADHPFKGMIMVECNALSPSLKQRPIERQLIAEDGSVLHIG